MPSADEMREALKTVYDPEIPINIVDLGLIYKVAEVQPGKVYVEFTLTTPTCPIGDQLAARIREALGRLNGVTAVSTALVWSPPWTRAQMTADGKLQASLLGFG